MGKIEDIMVYTKVAILLVIAGLFIEGESTKVVYEFTSNFSVADIFTVAAITFVAYEGFQLVIHAYEETENPRKNVPSAIYWAIGCTTLYMLCCQLAPSLQYQVNF